MIYFPPVEILSSDIVTKKDCVQREKYDLISFLQYFPPSTQSVTVEKLLHGLISYIFPQLDFCALLV